MAKNSTTPEGVDAPTVPVKARVLVQCDLGDCNAVIEIDPDLAATMAGIVDTDPAAVAYAESLAGA